MSERNFFAELKRRNVYKVAGAYAVVAWVIAQVATQIFPFLEIPNWAIRLVILLIGVGFPIALVIAWAFELTPEGIKRTEAVEDGAVPVSKNRAWIYVVVIGAALSIALFFLGRYTAGSKQTASRETAEKSIAVLPFQNLSGDKENAYFTDGVQDEILTTLAKVADLKVISRTSVMQYKETEKRNLPEIAQALKVAHVVEGSVQRVANRVRVSAQLIDARTDAHLWAEHYDRPLDDVLAIQSEIAQKIAEQLQAVLSPNEQAALHAKPTQDMLAYDLYLRAKEIERNRPTPFPENLNERVHLLDQVVARDPAFVAALCLLASAHLQMYWFNHDHTAARLELAKKALNAAARLQPDAGEVHLARAKLYYWGSRDYASALAELALARRSLPNDADTLQVLASIERRQGQWDGAIRHFEEARTIDPRNVGPNAALAVTYLALRRYADAARVFEEVLVWNPGDFNMQGFRAWVDVVAQADLRRLQSVVFGDSAKWADARVLATLRLRLALWQRDYRAAEQALLAYPGPNIIDAESLTPKEFFSGLIARGLADPAKAQTAFGGAREKAAAMVAERPDDAKELIILAEIDARLGRKTEAIREGEQAAELRPLSKDEFDGPEILTRLAGVLAQVGETHRALDLLEQVSKMPGSSSSTYAHYGVLKLNEVWDPLRGDPRFEKIVASLAPKESAATNK